MLKNKYYYDINDNNNQIVYSFHEMDIKLFL